MSQSIHAGAGNNADDVGDALPASERLNHLLEFSRSLREFSSQVRDFSESVRQQAFLHREELRTRSFPRAD